MLDNVSAQESVLGVSAKSGKTRHLNLVAQFLENNKFHSEEQMQFF